MANMYGSHMVLQQAPAKANIWGYVTKCDSKLTASINKTKLTPQSFTGIIVSVCQRICIMCMLKGPGAASFNLYII